MRKVPFQLAHLSLAGATFKLDKVDEYVDVAQVGNLIAAVPLDTNYPPRFYSLEGVPVGNNGSYLVTLLPPVTHKEPFSYARYCELKGKGVKALTRSEDVVRQLFLFEGVAEAAYPLRGVYDGDIASWTTNGSYYRCSGGDSLDLVALEWEE